ncbi:MAG: imidazole glycerol phosphate synthase subunit HisH [Verrucomicrobiales bacterium]|nr:imidazole glycerol phosphate synthase subunit HisH [Verrucomicrobiales bacterium]|tara:strand:+ start:1186 stop:1803 length:618 start_codon:yes stop_codon:yes gene_type:complete
MIALLDYGAGNLRSVEKALRYVGSDVELMRTPDRVKEAAAVVLPGVGAFDDCVNAMQRQELFEAAKEFANSGRPFLGICVGYQALFERSEEFNSCASGLGLFQGNVIRFPSDLGLKIPQIGWNQIEITQPDCPIYKGVDSGSHVYFVHSFYPNPEDDSISATCTNYGVNFVSSIWRDNIFATQFHPEKSQRIGLKILENFVNLSR